jgi:pimeloyl-ACP methyl ester carboxylesterase
MRLAARRWPSTLDTGAPTILLLHGVTSSSRTWWRIGPEVAARGWQTLALDLRCHGESPCADVGRPNDLSEDVHETLVAELGDARVDVAWGHSLGARTAMQLLRDHPGTASRVVLEDPPGGPRGDRQEAIAAWRYENALARTDPATFREVQRRDNIDWDERDIDENIISVASCRIEPIIAAYEAGFNEDQGAPNLVRHLRVPALLVLADEERSALTGEDRPATITRLPAGSTVLDVRGGHTLHRDVPATYLAGVFNWLAAAR